MITKSSYKPSIAIHPGKTLEETLDAISMSQVGLALRTGLTTKTINEIIKCKNPITADTAIKLSNVFGMSASFWNNLQKNYDETVARLNAERALESEVALFRKFTCYNELAKWGYVKNTSVLKEKINNLLGFFGVSSLSRVLQTYAVAFRKANVGSLSNECLAAWLRCGEIDAKQVETQPFDKNRLLNSIGALRALTNEPPEKFHAKLIGICQSCGVAVVFVPYFKNTCVSGATRWINSDKALIQLSLMGRSDDKFWFTFFHELAHILEHGKKDQFVEFEKRNRIDELEKEADEIAGNILIPKIQLKQFMNSNCFAGTSIKAFAKNIGVSPSIVAGRLEHETKCWGQFARFHNKLKFKESSN